MQLVSPNDMIAAAKQHMLAGQDPKTTTDWEKVLNFVAFNIAVDGIDNMTVMLSLFTKMYDIKGLSKADLRNIARFQLNLKKQEK